MPQIRNGDTNVLWGMTPGALVENECMSERFKWVPDLARGEWLRPMEAETFGSIL